ncbi:Polyprenol reductase 1 [Fusarium oxysporum f. sp. albedinis]|nr:Polyprenol reductase 1 [Fusarium oxysporum f. sp. albedinis]
MRISQGIPKFRLSSNHAAMLQRENEMCHFPVIATPVVYCELSVHLADFSSLSRPCPPYPGQTPSTPTNDNPTKTSEDLAARLGDACCLLSFTTRYHELAACPVQHQTDSPYPAMFFSHS